MKLTARVALLCLAASARAWAEAPAGLGARAPNIVTVENLFGALELNSKAGDDDDTASLTQRYVPTSGLTQLGYHRVVAPRVTVGANVLALRAKSGDADAMTAAFLRPRLGYTLPLSSALSAWLRGGVLVAHQRDGDSRYTALSAGVDVLVAVTPAPHVGLFGGILFESPLWGRSKRDGHDSEKHELTSTGLSVGALVDF